jgi:glycerophosphoryl diester phosphodiesterase
VAEGQPAAAATGRSVTAPRAPGEPVRVLAHRGFAAAHAENTVAAFGRAAGAADAVEMDVRRCGSGELVVVHDATVDRVTDATGRVEELPLARLRDLDVGGSGEGVPTLRAALAAVPPDTAVVVELKEPVVEDALAVLDVDNEVVVTSFDPAVVERVAEHPAASAAQLALPGDREALSHAVEVGCAAVHPERMTVFVDPDYVERAHAAGLAVNVWNVAGPDDAARLASAGVDGVAADSPAVLDQTRG